MQSEIAREISWAKQVCRDYRELKIFRTRTRVSSLEFSNTCGKVPKRRHINETRPDYHNSNLSGGGPGHVALARQRTRRAQLGPRQFKGRSRGRSRRKFE